jgi:hypothetical protein
MCAHDAARTYDPRTVSVAVGVRCKAALRTTLSPSLPHSATECREQIDEMGTHSKYRKFQKFIPLDEQKLMCLLIIIPCRLEEFKKAVDKGMAGLS